MASLADLLTELLPFLEQAHVEYMITGSLASISYSDTRATKDADIVIVPEIFNIESFVKSLDSERFYVGDFATAVENRDMFNVIDSSSGWKLDLIIRKDRPFSIEEFGRRQSSEIFGIKTYVASVEDLILAKLEWAKSSGSLQQLRDVGSMIEYKRDELDLNYLFKWADELDVRMRLDEFLAEFPPSGS